MLFPSPIIVHTIVIFIPCLPGRQTIKIFPHPRCPVASSPACLYLPYSFFFQYWFFILLTCWICLSFSRSFLSVLHVKTLFYLHSSLSLTILTFTYFPNVSAVAFLPLMFILLSYFPLPSCPSTLHFPLLRFSFFCPSAVSYRLISFLKHSFSISFISPSYCYFSFGIFATAENGLVFPLSCQHGLIFHECGKLPIHAFPSGALGFLRARQESAIIYAINTYYVDLVEWT
jgi:hypothetical protein